MPSEIKRSIHRQYVSLEPISIEAPEFPDKDGNPTVLRFKRRLNVDDVAALGVIDFEGQSMDQLHTQLFRVLAIDEEGNRLVDPNDDEWFRTGTDGTLISKVAERANLVSVLGLTHKRAGGEASPDAEGKD